MRTKVSTLLDERVFRRVKLEALRSHRQISEVVGDALVYYLDATRAPSGAGGVVSRTFGALAAPPEVVRQVLEEEDGLYDA
jgi:hypothetical protein